MDTPRGDAPTDVGRAIPLDAARAGVDVVVVGSGINSLVCAALLALGGLCVCVLEQADELGGAIRTAELTLPGFTHDVLSAWHPLFVASEAYAELGADLERHGLSYLTGHGVTASVTTRGDAAFFTRSRAENEAELDRRHGGDGARFRKDRRGFESAAPLVTSLLTSELPSSAALRAALATWRRLGTPATRALAGRFFESARTWLETTYLGHAPGDLFAPWVLHTGLGPDGAGSGIMGRTIVTLIEDVGLPVPRGGGARLVEALRAVIGEHGGSCVTGADVARVEVVGERAAGVRLSSGERIGARRAVVCSVTPGSLYGRLLEDVEVPGWARHAASRFRFGRAGMQIHYALDAPPRWRTDDRLVSSSIVHLTAGLDGVSRAVAEAERGLLPAEATVVCGQPCAVDPSRAPEGSWILWIQLQELPSRPRGDARTEIDVGDGTWNEDLRERYADRIEARLSHHIEGFESTVLSRVALSPADIEAMNPNLVGGDIYAGACDLDQSFVLRPRPELRGHATPVPGLYQIGASTHPGPGVSGASGTLVARRILGRKRRR